MIHKLTFLTLLCIPALAYAENAPVALGPRFSGPYEVSFKPFTDAKRLEKRSTNEVARFEHADKKWMLEFDRIDLPGEVTLKDSVNANGVATAGYLSVALNQLRAHDTKADVLRSEAIDLGDLQIGIIVAQTSINNQPTLLQQALIQIQPRLYYSLVMSSPAPGGPIEKTPELVEASDTFRAIVDSIESVDLTKMREDQDERLFRTRALFVDWNQKKLLSVLEPAHMLRFRQDDKDIGYAYIVEQPADALPKAGEVEKNAEIEPEKATGVRVGIRTRIIDKDGRSVETDNWMFVTFDRRHEVWSTMTNNLDPTAKTEKLKHFWFSQVGASDLKRQREFDSNLKPDDLKDFDAKNRDAGANAPAPYREVDQYKLTVREEGSLSAVGEPLQRDLPPFYLPQALAAMLPRLVPLNNPTGYLFASYNNETRQIMLRYVDILSERDVMLQGKTVRAIPVVDRLGFDGIPTTHYLSPKGELLESINEAGKIEVTPTDEATLLKIWKDASLAQPGAVK